MSSGSPDMWTSDSISVGMLTSSERGGDLRVGVSNGSPACWLRISSPVAGRRAGVRAIAPVRPGRVGDHPAARSPTEDDPMLDGARIFHVNVNCSDLAASRAFYVERVRADRRRPHDARRRAVGRRVRPRPGAVGRVDPRRRRRLRRRRRRPPRMAGAAPDRVARRDPDEPASPASASRWRRRRAGDAVADPDGVVVELVPGATPGLVARRGHVRRPRPLARVLPRARLPRAGADADPSRTRSCSTRRAAARCGSCSRAPAGDRAAGAARPANTIGHLADRAPRRRLDARWPGCGRPGSRCSRTRRRWRWARACRTCASSASAAPTTRSSSSSSHPRDGAAERVAPTQEDDHAERRHHTDPSTAPSSRPSSPTDIAASCSPAAPTAARSSRR